MAQAGPAPLKMRLFPETQNSHPPKLQPYTLNRHTHALHLPLVLKECGFPPEAKTWAHGDPKNANFRCFLKGRCIFQHAFKTLKRYKDQQIKRDGISVERATFVITAVPNSAGKTVAYVLTLYVNSIEVPEAKRIAAVEENENDPQPPPLEEEGEAKDDGPVAMEEGEEDGKAEVVGSENMEEEDGDGVNPESTSYENQEYWFDAVEDIGYAIPDAEAGHRVKQLKDRWLHMPVSPQYLEIYWKLCCCFACRQRIVMQICQEARNQILFSV
jgi:hypothetical protein